MLTVIFYNCCKYIECGYLTSVTDCYIDPRTTLTDGNQSTVVNMVVTYSLGRRSDLFTWYNVNQKVKLIIFADSHCNVITLTHTHRSKVTHLLRKGKGKEEYLYSAYIQHLVSKSSDMDHTVLPAINSMPAFPS